MSYPDPNEYVQRPTAALAIVLAVLMLLIALASVATPAEIVIPEDQPSETIAVQLLIDQFDSQDYVVRTDVYSVTPAFAIYAEAAAKLDGAAPMLAAVLADSEDPQVRLAAACGLEACGPKAIIAAPLLKTMLESPDSVDRIMACAIVRGIGPEAASLLSPLRTLLQAENFHVQYWACRAIAAMGDAGEPAVADLCLLLTTDQPASVRRNACIALGEVAGCSPDLDKVVEILEDVENNDYSHPVRVEATAALEKFFGPPLDGPLTVPDGVPTLAPPEVDCR
jgi:HEAT repeat protein